MDNKRAYRRFMRHVKIRSRKKEFADRFWGEHSMKFLAKTPKLCSSSACCGNYRATEGPPIQEKRARLRGNE